MSDRRKAYEKIRDSDGQDEQNHQKKREESELEEITMLDIDAEHSKMLPNKVYRSPQICSSSPL